MEQEIVKAGEALVESELQHFGVKGMKWGVRKSHPLPSATEARAESVVTRNRFSKSKIKTSGGENHPPTEDAIKVALARQKMKKSGTVALTNKELQDMATRMNLEQQVHRLETSQPRSLGRKTTEALLKDPVRTIETTGRTAEQVNRLLAQRR